MTILKLISIIFISLSLTGFKSNFLSNPEGPIAYHEKQLFILAILLMSIIVIPVIFLTFFFAWRYRSSSYKKKIYSPEWSDSIILEIIWWTIPCIIISILAIMTWKTSKELDPYKPIESEKTPIEIEVVALNWKWMFIYPQYNITTINEIFIPVNYPIHFKITSAAPMNSFFIPQLGSQIYAMKGMMSQLHLLATHEGQYRGFSSNYTGNGFAYMQFYVHSTNEENFNMWLNKVKNDPKILTCKLFWEDLIKDSINNPITYYGKTEKNIFNDIIMNYLMPYQQHWNNN